MWKLFNNNPSGRYVGDCAVRAVSKALDVTWEAAYALMCIEGYLMNDMPSSNAVFGAVLRRNGFKRYDLGNECPDCYTLEDFARDHPQGLFVVGMGGHVATVIDGVIYDAWDSRNEIPVYVWRK